MRVEADGSASESDSADEDPLAEEGDVGSEVGID
jgi:hypothetical protein